MVLVAAVWESSLRLAVAVADMETVDTLHMMLPEAPQRKTCQTAGIPLDLERLAAVTGPAVLGPVEVVVDSDRKKVAGRPWHGTSESRTWSIPRRLVKSSSALSCPPLRPTVLFQHPESQGDVESRSGYRGSMVM
jgi:hypothetical protein